MSLGEPTYLHRACAWSTPSTLIGSIPTPQVLVHLQPIHHHQDRHLQIQNWLFGYQQQRSTTQAFKLPRLPTRDSSVRTPAYQKLRFVRALFGPFHPALVDPRGKRALGSRGLMAFPKIIPNPLGTVLSILVPIVIGTSESLIPSFWLDRFS
ncbi:hypothetical protein M378DRAFT_531925 [Amanita muscaria Koide BX008]|uniref:Uncharacterized protein n=1 Tax=Amanita muscaria (strain Koide BX008) TaxID=946122 RepID=A0A0C2WJE4_AMAMK|nr:hypothetical protein M378DRAFT_531925 [Amanita muscaria Koide BX008]